MTTPIKTKCPKCSICFNLPESLLHKTDAKVRCSRCQAVFSVNEHLIVSAEHPFITADVTTPRNSLSKQVTLNTKEAIHHYIEEDVLIADQATDTDGCKDSQVDDDQDGNRYSDSINEQAHWFDKLKALSSKDYYENKDHESIADSSSAFDTNSPSWITTLLKEEKNRLHDSDSDSEMNLSRLLTDMGSPPINQDKQGNSGQEAHASIATMLWLAGCLVLVLLLFAQYVIFNLDTLIKDPASAARLQAVCSIAACSLPNADLSLLSITKPSHGPSTVNKENTFSDVKAELVNHSLQPQLLPSLKVSIYGTNALIGEFIALPEDYLLSAQSQITAENGKPVMFTIPVADNQISQVTINPIY